ncbi:WD40-repeat-containing domain protein [Suillus subalutaceus]|uniref:WD40-repeat-containing domain protein n=1 Tax=Suillus subalutaceus TaxID=48586 RepID=UPI001B877DD1|nr:WD40-repeat-containing domain protein [Suillus subalutaceus]KAG1838017.1 WD40-repeat-containing domain protein [Suillus subalutaceus]
MSYSTSKTPAVMPCRMMQGHTRWVNGVMHLHGGGHIITCSTDGSLRLWGLESGTQIGEDWQDEGDNAGVWSMALSPNGETIASGHDNGEVRLWNIETRRVITRWTGRSNVVWSLCWSADGNQVLSGSRDGTVRIWDVKSGKTVLTIKTGHKWMNAAVIYPPDATKIATGGDDKDGVKIWDAKTGKLFKTLISGQIFDTTTWEEIVVLEGHTDWVNATSLSGNGHILASASVDKTVCLWNLDTNRQVVPLEHEDVVRCVALSLDGKVLVTVCPNGNVYTWDIHAILKVLATGTNIAPKYILEQKASQDDKCTPRSSISNKSFLEADATRCHDEFGGVDELSPRFFDGMEADVDSSPTGSTHPHSSATPLLVRIFLLLNRFRFNKAEVTELPQPSTPSGLHLRVLFARLFSLVHRSPPENDAATELQQSSTPSQLDPHVLLIRLSSLWPRHRLNTDEETEPHPMTPSEIELSQYTRRPHVVEVAAVRDREVIFTAPPLPQKTHQQTQSDTQGHAHSLPVRMLAHLVLFLCCASPQHADTNTQSTQQHGQPQGQVQAQVSSSQTWPATPLASATPPAPAVSTAAPGAASA